MSASKKTKKTKSSSEESSSQPSPIRSNPVIAPGDWPPVVIAGASQVAVNMMRNLVRRDVRVYCFDCDPDQPAFRSAYGQAHRSPHPVLAEENWLEFMGMLAKKMAAQPVLLIANPLFAHAIAAAADKLSRDYILHLDSMPVLQALLSRQQLTAIAEANGVAIPPTQVLESPENASEVKGSFNYPCLLKPLEPGDWENLPGDHPFAGRTAKEVATPEALEAAYNQIAPVTPLVILQEIVPGPDTDVLSYVCLFGRKGTRIAGSVLRHVRSFPVQYGPASLLEPAFDAQLERLCDRFLQSLNFSGVCEMVAKRDSRDGTLKLLNVYPYYTVASDAVTPSGVDLPWLQYLEMIGLSVIPAHAEVTEYRHIVLARDLHAFHAHRLEQRLTLGALLKSYRKGAHFFDLDRDDRALHRLRFRKYLKTLFGPYFGNDSEPRP